MGSLPSWERGLKQDRILSTSMQQWSLPSWERGLKRFRRFAIYVILKSLPSWERGLKHEGEVIDTWHHGRSLRGSVD